MCTKNNKAVTVVQDFTRKHISSDFRRKVFDLPFITHLNYIVVFIFKFIYVSKTLNNKYILIDRCK